MHSSIVVAGLTATGKTALGVALAHHFFGEIISADSRQVYQGLDIVTGKDLPDTARFCTSDKLQQQLRRQLGRTDISIGWYTIDQIPVWGLDIIKPDADFDVATYTQIAQAIVTDISARGKIPILVGGTGLYLESVCAPKDTFGVGRDLQLRTQLDTCTVIELQQRLKQVDPKKWQQMNRSDRYNPRRLIRAIEVKQLKKTRPQPEHLAATDVHARQIPATWIGLGLQKSLLAKRITARVKHRLSQGAVQELHQLQAQGYELTLPALSSLGYSQLALYQDGTLDKNQCILAWTQAELAYAKRQSTWFKKQPQITWFDANNDFLVDKVITFVRE